jgi:sortase A
VVLCRRNTYGAPCRDIDSLVPGAEIVVTSHEGVFAYTVTDVFTVGLGEEDVTGPTEDDVLTLASADPLFGADGRVVVRAELEGEPFDPGLVTGGVFDPDPIVAGNDLGLDRDGSAWLGVVVWGQVLAVACIVTVALWGRWRKWSTWVIASPLLGMIALLFFEHVDRLLPSTY